MASHSKGGWWRADELAHGTVGMYARGCKCVPCKQAKTASNRKAALKRNYGISVEEYDTLYDKQEGKCEICGTFVERYLLVVDHDHSTGKIRGLLCRQHNSAIGMLGDTPELVRAALEYLEGAP